MNYCQIFFFNLVTHISILKSLSWGSWLPLTPTSSKNLKPIDKKKKILLTSDYELKLKWHYNKIVFDFEIIGAWASSSHQCCKVLGSQDK